MGFALFLALNGILFIRPAELYLPLAPFRLYLLTIGSCVLSGYPELADRLTTRSLARRPVTLCVLGLLGTVILSHLRHGSIYEARVCGFAYAKLVLYFFLLVSQVNSRRRFQTFVTSLILFTGIASSLALLQFHGYLSIEALQVYEQREIDDETGEVIVFPRLCGAGMFNDPNDIAVLIVISMMLCMYRATSKATGTLMRLSTLALFCVFGYTFLLTKSRGGMLTLGAASMTCLACRFGVKRAALVSAVLLPAVLAFVGGRMANIDVNDGTGQHRIQLWREALALVREYPLFGVGQGMLAEYTRLVAHNSYVHSFAELGLIGGGCFTSLVYLSISDLWKAKAPLKNSNAFPNDFQPFMTGIVAGFATGIMALSRLYVVPSYLVFGLTAAWLNLREQEAPLGLSRASGGLVVKLAGLTICTFLTLEFGSRLLVRWD